MINCFQCEQGAFDSVISSISGNNDCLTKANDANTSVQTVTCPTTAKCYTKLRTAGKYAYAVERGCWNNYDDKDDDDNCDAAQENGCTTGLNTGMCFKCCNTNRCNANFAQLDGVLNGVTGLHHFSVLVLLPVAVAMFF
ncbi:uncharacterized protein LOC144860588 isoform X2 [Branchiostoma floridae x Branchiostoma japonicum]